MLIVCDQGLSAGTCTIADNLLVYPLTQALLPEVLQAPQQATTTQAQVPPLVPALAQQAMAAATLVTQPAQKAPLQPRPRATSQALLRTKPPKATAAAATAARQTFPATTAAAAPLHQVYQAPQAQLVQLALVSPLARPTPLAMSRPHSRAALFTMLMVLQLVGMAATVATPALPWAGQVPLLAPAVVHQATAVETLAAAQALAVA